MNRKEVKTEMILTAREDHLQATITFSCRRIIDNRFYINVKVNLEEFSKIGFIKTNQTIIDVDNSGEKEISYEHGREIANRIKQRLENADVETFDNFRNIVNSVMEMI